MSRRKQIVTKLLDATQLHSVRLDPDALDKRIGNLLKSQKDDDKVEMVVRVIARRDKKNFRISQSLSWNTFAYVARQLSTSSDSPIPDGGWEYALWRFDILTFGELSPKGKDYAMSIDYHLANWADAEDPMNTDPTTIKKSKEYLKRLRRTWDAGRMSV